MHQIRKDIPTDVIGRHHDGAAYALAARGRCADSRTTIGVRGARPSLGGMLDPELEALAAAAVHDSALQGGYGDLFTRFDLTDAIDRAIDALPDAFREVVLLVDVNDQSYETAAATLDTPIGTVRSRLFRARRLLQEALISHAHDAGLIRPTLGAGSPGEKSR
jgi:DNA-directed RNA polymerase specialized sigma24 family protein